MRPRGKTATSHKLLNQHKIHERMTCQTCATEPYFEQRCTRCFIEQIEKRIKRDIRVNAPVLKGDVLVITHPLCEAVIKDIIHGLPITITKDDHAQGRGVLLWTMEDEIQYFLNKFLQGEDYSEIGHGNDIKLFLTIREKELEAFARAKGFSYTSKPKDKLRELVDKFEAKYPETKFSLAKSIEEIKKAISIKE